MLGPLERLSGGSNADGVMGSEPYLEVSGRAGGEDSPVSVSSVSYGVS